jgi:hypothetical protein
VSWEVELAAHLAAGGVPVPRVKPLADGKVVGKLDSAEGVRPFTLAEFIEATNRDRRSMTTSMPPSDGWLPPSTTPLTASAPSAAGDRRYGAGLTIRSR